MLIFLSLYNRISQKEISLKLLVYLKIIIIMLLSTFYYFTYEVWVLLYESLSKINVFIAKLLDLTHNLILEIDMIIFFR